ncbi:MAG TPA: arginine--tRNA ligase [Mycobacteriales bacterium]|nr:arginine--tRNA ligase [Mycobacteriales bacterium]
MTPADLAEAVRAALDSAVADGAIAVPIPDEIVIERPRTREHGDYATNIAMRLAKPAGRKPREVAELIAERLGANPEIERVDVAGPGFLNITVASGALGALARTIVTAADSYGQTAVLAGQHLNLEYVSANPTGPVHIAHARWAAVGDALGRLLQASGATVTREYYFNDAGTQIDRFTASIYAAAQGKPIPEDGYQGDYIERIGAQVRDGHPDALAQPEADALETFRREGVALMFADIRRSLAAFGVEFDVFFNERDLYEKGQVDDAVQRLRDGGHVYEADGAVWLRTTDFGDDKDRVIVRSAKFGGRPTYFCSDLAYYIDKRERGADKVIILLGADHHGYVGRMRSMVAGMGQNPDETLEIIIGQMVNVQGARLSKRAGNMVTLDDLIAAIGADAGRYNLVRASMDSPVDLDLDLWASKTSDNPVFYVQYAHARLASLQRNAADLGIERGTDFDPALLSHDREADLLVALGEFPRVVTAAAELREPHRVARYAEELAGTYHRFYDSCRVLPRGDEVSTPVTVARLWLCEATRTVLANALGLLGVSAPTRM